MLSPGRPWDLRTGNIVTGRISRALTPESLECVGLLELLLKQKSYTTWQLKKDTYVLGYAEVYEFFLEHPHI